MIETADVAENCKLTIMVITDVLHDLRSKPNNAGGMVGSEMPSADTFNLEFELDEIDRKFK